jgi:hypothetical protein
MATTTILNVLPHRFSRNKHQWDCILPRHHPRKFHSISPMARRPSASPMLVGPSENTSDYSDGRIGRSAPSILAKQGPMGPHATPVSPQKVSFHSDAGETSFGLKRTPITFRRRIVYKKKGSLSVCCGCLSHACSLRRAYKGSRTLSNVGRAYVL